MAGAWMQADRTAAASVLREAALREYRKRNSQQHRVLLALIQRWEEAPERSVEFAVLAAAAGIEDDGDPERLKLHALKYRIERRLDSMARSTGLTARIESARGDGYRLVVEPSAGARDGVDPGAIRAEVTHGHPAERGADPGRAAASARWVLVVTASLLVMSSVIGWASWWRAPEPAGPLELRRVDRELLATWEGRVVARWDVPEVEERAAAARRRGAPAPASEALDSVEASKAYRDDEGRVRLLVPVSQTGLGDGASLLVLDDDGETMARIPALDERRQIRHAREPMIPDYWLSGNHVGLVRIGPDARLTILAIFTNVPSDPVRIACIDATTCRVIGEYWNAGHVSVHAFDDCDGDGTEELILGVAHDGHDEGAVVVLDMSRMRGQSPSLGCEGYTFLGVPAGTQRQYIRFPRAMATAAKGDISTPLRIQMLAGLLHVEVSQHVPGAEGKDHYYLDPRDGRLRCFVLSDAVAQVNAAWLREAEGAVVSRVALERGLARVQAWRAPGAWEVSVGAGACEVP